MAGFGAACSQIGAIFFAVEAGLRILEADVHCCSIKWLMPSSISSVPYAELRSGVAWSENMYAINFLATPFFKRETPIFCL